ncbi:hypothetical protein [Collimonas humicola]|uniref:hypothetical protein n=1 Tax=Collimonas humicola TaxID=2825886 RepID=UPI001B8D56EB|nr:hypothetical protein [Collimonas humicola]
MEIPMLACEQGGVSNPNTAALRSHHFAGNARNCKKNNKRRAKLLATENNFGLTIENLMADRFTLENTGDKPVTTLASAYVEYKSYLSPDCHCQGNIKNASIAL